MKRSKQKVSIFPAVALLTLMLVLAVFVNSCSNSVEEASPVVEVPEVYKANTSSSLLIKEVYNALKADDFDTFLKLHGTKESYIKLVEARTDLNDRDKQDKINFANYHYDGFQDNVKAFYNEILNNSDSVSLVNLEFKKIEYTKESERAASAFIILTDQSLDYKILVTNCVNTPEGWFIFTDVRWLGNIN